ncbi:hypothetical protein L1987_61522 [Smallanthus sonchifolius]|uniref:Uncharacterized protein n=1 Tax=Smallanthus sonchifolius TaxID=185202 RepID=A0ACB9C7S6_9ASTR|nr:hypothetical protein L1987_61522 [Smallanthus sonchifolius]
MGIDIDGVCEKSTETHGNLLEMVMKRRMLVPGISKSQEFVIVKKKRATVFASSRSMGSSPRREAGYINADMLDVLDGLGKKELGYTIPDMLVGLGTTF